jgi:hypothetical protein
MFGAPERLPTFGASTFQLLLYGLFGFGLLQSVGIFRLTTICFAQKV